MFGTDKAGDLRKEETAAEKSTYKKVCKGITAVLMGAMIAIAFLPTVYDGSMMYTLLGITM